LFRKGGKEFGRREEEIRKNEAFAGFCGFALYFTLLLP